MLQFLKLHATPGLYICRLMEKYGYVPRFTLDQPSTASAGYDFDVLEYALDHVSLDKVGSISCT